MAMWIWIAVAAVVLLAVVEEVIYFVLNKQLGLERESKWKKCKRLFQKGASFFKREKKRQDSQSA
jgi:membrane protein DedA with SNARE-associated domain